MQVLIEEEDAWEENDDDDDDDDNGDEEEVGELADKSITFGKCGWAGCTLHSQAEIFAPLAVAIFVTPFESVVHERQCGYMLLPPVQCIFKCFFTVKRYLVVTREYCWCQQYVNFNSQLATLLNIKFPNLKISFFKFSEF